MKPLQPGATLGIAGGGQLGRMTAIAARRMGYRTIIFTDERPGCPAAQVADGEISSSWYDQAAREKFASQCDVVTVEFENVPAAFLRGLNVPVFPPPAAVEICQNREREKTFLRQHSIPHAEFRVVTDPETLAAAQKELGGAGVLKTADFGYDGKGQKRLHGGENAAEVWAAFNAPRAVLEQWVDFDLEISVVCARGQDGTFAHFPVCENIHTNHILDISIAPARISAELAAEAAALAKRVAEALNYVGTLAVELFVTRDGRVIVNELAPRPHNSGHHTLDACAVSQFEQHVLCVCGWPPAAATQHAPSAMLNLLGDLWPAEDAPRDWSAVLQHPRARFHLYGKKGAKRGRKMGHITLTADTAEEALAEAKALKETLAAGSR